jgi:hypothetical protein
MRGVREESEGNTYSTAIVIRSFGAVVSVRRRIASNPLLGGKLRQTPCPLEVTARVRLLMRCGIKRASSSAIIPPIESPTTSTSAAPRQPTWERSDSTSAAIALVEYLTNG